MILIKIWHGALNAKLFCCFYSFTLIDEFISDTEMANNICSKFQSNDFLMCFFLIMNIKQQSLLCIYISVHTTVYSKYTADMLQYLHHLIELLQDNIPICKYDYDRNKNKLIYMHFLRLRVIHNKPEVDRCSVARYVLCNSYMNINIAGCVT